MLKKLNIGVTKFSLARLRSGHHPELREYMYRLDPQIEETCYIYGDAIMTLNHWIMIARGSRQNDYLIRRKFVGRKR